MERDTLTLLLGGGGVPGSLVRESDHPQTPILVLDWPI
jgi:hypothetical protein